MADLDERFRSFSRTRTPDLWPEIEGREPRSETPPTPSWQRALAAAVALVVAVAGIGLAALTFGGSEHPRRTPAAVPNARIAFVGVGEQTWNVYTIEPDGQGLTKLTDLSNVVADDPAWSPDRGHIAFVVRGNGGGGRSDLWVMDADGTHVRALTDGPGSSWAPTWSPNGSRIAYTHEAPDQAAQIWIMDADGSNQRAFTYCDGTECVSDDSPAWSPDGSRLAFVRVSGAGAIIPVSVFVWPVQDSDPKPEDISLEGATWASGLSWSPDGSRLAFARSTSAGGNFGLWQVDADGSNLSPLGDRPSAQSPTWSPDGRQIAFMAPVGPEQEALFVMSADGTDVRKIPGLPENAVSPSWQPIVPAEQPQPEPGRMANGSIYFRVGGGDGGSQIDAVEPDGSDRRVAFADDPMRIAQIAWSPDGTKIAYQDPIVDERGIFVANADGTEAVRLTQGVNDAWPSWSPDGTRIVFSSTRYDPTIPACTPGEDFNCPTDLYIASVDGSNIARLTTDSGAEYQPAWSPDGDRIAFSSSPDLNSGVISSIRVDGADRLVLSSGEGGSDFWPSWSPDGSRLVFAAIRNEDWGIWSVRADESNERVLFGGSKAGYVNNPVWSPDGSMIAFVGNTFIDDYSPEDALYVMNADGTSMTPIADAPRVGVAGDIAWQPVASAAEPEPTPSAAPTVRAEVADVIPIQGPPGAVSAATYGLGSTWVASFDEGGEGKIARLDEDTGNILAEIPTGDVVPTSEVGGGGLTVGSGSVWMAGLGRAPDGSSGWRSYLLQVNPATNEVVRKVDLHASAPADVAVDGSGVWVMSFGTGDRRMELSRVDPATDEIVTIPIDATSGGHLFAVGGRIVAQTNETSNSMVGATVLHIIDPIAAVETSTVPLDTYAWLAAGDLGSGLWESNGNGFASLDPATGRVITAFEGFSGTGDALAVGEGGIWFISPHHRATVSRFDPSVGDVDVTIDLPNGTTPVALATSPNAVWVLNYEGTLTHVALR